MKSLYLSVLLSFLLPWAVRTEAQSDRNSDPFIEQILRTEREVTSRIGDELDSLNDRLLRKRLLEQTSPDVVRQLQKEVHEAEKAALEVRAFANAFYIRQNALDYQGKLKSINESRKTALDRVENLNKKLRVIIARLIQFKDMEKPIDEDENGPNSLIQGIYQPLVPVLQEAAWSYDLPVIAWFDRTESLIPPTSEWGHGEGLVKAFIKPGLAVELRVAQVSFYIPGYEADATPSEKEWKRALAAFTEFYYLAEGILERLEPLDY
ncbi:MAG: hypothetical protein HY402_05745 [Elusimicrobia bacterium]|nr:hypothetical protein [Elusimicrobiota bacterium]